MARYDLVGALQRNTAGTVDAMSGLAAAKRASKDRQRRAAADLGASLRQIGKDWQENLDWRAAKQAEEETRQINEAFNLGATMKGAQGSLTAMNAMRAKTARGADLLAKRRREAVEDVRYQTEWEAKEAAATLDKRQLDRAIKQDEALNKYHDEQTKIERDREARQKEEGIRSDKLTAFKTYTELMRNFTKGKTTGDKMPDDDDQLVPANQLRVIEKGARLPEGTLDGFTFRGLRAYHSMRETDPDGADAELKRRADAARAAKLEQEVRRSTPEYRKARRDRDNAQKAYDSAERNLREFQDRMATADPFADTKKMADRETALKADAEKARKALDATPDPDDDIGGPEQGAPSDQPEPEVMDAWTKKGYRWDAARGGFVR